MARSDRRTGHRAPAGMAVGRHNTALTVITPDDDAPVEIPKAPTGLLKSTRDAWTSFWESDVSHAVDRSSDLLALERWIHAIDERERSMQTLRKYRLVKGSMGQPTLSPLAKYVAQLDSLILELEKRFGMTPLARVSLGLTAGEANITAEKLNAMLATRRPTRPETAELEPVDLEGDAVEIDEDVEWVAG